MTPDELCKLFNAYLATGRKMVKGLEEGASVCGVPPEVPNQRKAQQAKESQMAKQICEAAAPGRVRSFGAPVPHCTEKSLMPGVPCVD